MSENKDVVTPCSLMQMYACSALPKEVHGVDDSQKVEDHSVRPA